MPVIGFYEWQVEPDGKKQPYFVHVTDRPEFGLAAVWDRTEADDGSAIESFAIVTLPASPFMAEIHNAKKRQPAILRHEDHDAWLMDGPDKAFAALAVPGRATDGISDLNARQRAEEQRLRAHSGRCVRGTVAEAQDRRPSCTPSG